MEKKTWTKAELEEMPVIVLSLHERWWRKMAAGEKLLEIRKSKPQARGPYTRTEEDCGECSTHRNIKDLEEQWEKMAEELGGR